jgi:hypothetical protein
LLAQLLDQPVRSARREAGAREGLVREGGGRAEVVMKEVAGVAAVEATGVEEGVGALTGAAAVVVVGEEEAGVVGEERRSKAAHLLLVMSTSPQYCLSHTGPL